MELLPPSFEKMRSELLPPRTISRPSLKDTKKGDEVAIKDAFNSLVDRIAAEFDDINKNIDWKLQISERRGRDTELNLRSEMMDMRLRLEREFKTGLESAKQNLELLEEVDGKLRMTENRIKSAVVDISTEQSKKLVNGFNATLDNRIMEVNNITSDRLERAMDCLDTQVTEVARVMEKKFTDTQEKFREQVDINSKVSDTMDNVLAGKMVSLHSQIGEIGSELRLAISEFKSLHMELSQKIDFSSEESRKTALEETASVMNEFQMSRFGPVTEKVQNLTQKEIPDIMEKIQTIGEAFNTVLSEKLPALEQNTAQVNDNVTEANDKLSATTDKLAAHIAWTGEKFQTLDAGFRSANEILLESVDAATAQSAKLQQELNLSKMEHTRHLIEQVEEMKNFLLERMFKQTEMYDNNIDSVKMELESTIAADIGSSEGKIMDYVNDRLEESVRQVSELTHEQYTTLQKNIHQCQDMVKEESASREELSSSVERNVNRELTKIQNEFENIREILSEDNLQITEKIQATKQEILEKLRKTETDVMERLRSEVADSIEESHSNLRSLLTVSEEDLKQELMNQVQSLRSEVLKSKLPQILRSVEEVKDETQRNLHVAVAKLKNDMSESSERTKEATEDRFSGMKAQITAWRTKTERMETTHQETVEKLVSEVGRIREENSRLLDENLEYKKEIDNQKLQVQQLHDRMTLLQGQITSQEIMLFDVKEENNSKSADIGERTVTLEKRLEKVNSLVNSQNTGITPANLHLEMLKIRKDNEILLKGLKWTENEITDLKKLNPGLNPKRRGLEDVTNLMRY